LVLFGIATAVFLFGVLRSAATLSGTSFGYAVDLGGPIVAAVLVVAGGFYFGVPVGEFALTIFIRTTEPVSEVAKDAKLVVDFEGRRERSEISSSGEVTIKGIPGRLRNADIPINLESKSYRLKDPLRTYRIPANAVIYVDIIPISTGGLNSPEISSLLHPQFKPISDIAPELKRPRGPAQQSDDSYEAVYDHAHVLWIKPLLTIFVLPKVPAHKVVRYQETSWATDSDLFDEEKARIIFQTPADKHPPHGGIANLWRADPERWKWLGWLNWHCRFTGKIYYQQFDGGTVIGVFRLHPAQDDGAIFAVLDDGTWRVAHALSQAPQCETLGQQFPTR
jgi:hypothetical protein